MTPASPVRVLMLGWEFPPHISGGLGTACQGLVRGLVARGVDVTFVVPRAFGDEDGGGARIVGCNEVPLDVPSAPSATGAEPTAGSGTPAPAANRAPVDGPAPSPAAPSLFRTIAVDSPLSPYLSEATYAERLHGLRPAMARTEPTPVPPPIDAPTAASTAVLEAPPATDAGPQRMELAKRPLAFSGFYGPDLMAEVARYARVVEHLARTLDVDVIHAHDWMTWPAALAAKAVTGRPLVCHLHACEHDRSGDAPNPEIRDVEQRGFDAADVIVCVSHYTTGIVRKHYRVDPGKLRVVHNAVTQREQVEGWHVERTIDDPLVLFLGRVTFQKGPVYFLEAAARVARVLPRVRFVMSGSGDMLPRMIELAASMGLAKNVRFTGFLQGADVERMYAMADLYVMPSVSEPFGISPLEAMASDVPVIVSRQSGVSEVLKSALKVDFWDVEDLADKILALLLRPSLREALTSEGREELKTLRWERRAAELEGIYRGLSR